jgi:hypothetical protein
MLFNIFRAGIMKISKEKGMSMNNVKPYSFTSCSAWNSADLRKGRVWLATDRRRPRQRWSICSQQSARPWAILQIGWVRLRALFPIRRRTGAHPCHMLYAPTLPFSRASFSCACTAPAARQFIRWLFSTEPNYPTDWSHALLLSSLSVRQAVCNAVTACKFSIWQCQSHHHKDLLPGQLRRRLRGRVSFISKLPREVIRSNDFITTYYFPE